jgi:hemoglobin
MNRLVSLALAGSLLAALGACTTSQEAQERLGIPGKPATSSQHAGFKGPAAAVSQPSARPVDPNSLYARLGERAGIEAVVADFTNRMAKDRRVNRRFQNVNAQTFMARLTDQICQASGGPCTYTGKDMRAAHAGMKITNREWNITVAHLSAAMRAKGVKRREQREVLAVLGPMRGDIVGR